MIRAFRNWMDGLRGAGDHSISVPPMDGALRSNSLLEAADPVLAMPSPANLVEGHFSSGAVLYRLVDGQAVQVETYPAEIAALALRSGALAVALASGEIRIRGGRHDGKSWAAGQGLAINCPTALAFADDDTLIVANGSGKHGLAEWRQDLLRRQAAGSVMKLDLRNSQGTLLAKDLAWPYGVLPLADGGVLVSESWKARLVILRPGKAPEPVLTDLPAYPARIVPRADGGAWLTLFAPRRRIVELVMRETDFRETMMAEVAPEYWVSPSIRPMESYYEPLQGGTLKKLALLKPWAPSRSYGLVVELDAEFQPTRSFHSRADGTRHGISSCHEQDGRLLIAATGGDILISLPIAEAKP